MEKSLKDILKNWPRCFIQEDDLANLLNKTDDARYSIIKRALKSNMLKRVKKGLYFITEKTERELFNEFELALFIYQPSYISFESALSYHGWIPEAVYTTTAATSKRAQKFKTPFGMFRYKHVPEQHFYLGVMRLDTQNGVLFIASPWKALADFIYTRRKTWGTLENLELDLRIDIETACSSDLKLLKKLSEHYPSPRVRKELTALLKDSERYTH